MNIKIKLYGTLREYATHRAPYRWEGQLDDGGTVADAVSSVGCPPENVIRVIRDGKPLSPLESLDDGDLLYFIANLGIG